MQIWSVIKQPYFTASYATCLYTPWHLFMDSSCSLGEALRRLLKHYVLQYIIIKLAPKGEETSAVEVDNYKTNSLYSVYAVCLQWYIVKLASLGYTVTGTHINPYFSSTSYSCNIFILCTVHAIVGLWCKSYIYIQSGYCAK